MKLQFIRFVLKVQLFVGLLFFVQFSLAQEQLLDSAALMEMNGVVQKLRKTNIDSALELSNNLISNIKKPVDSTVYSSLLMTNAGLLRKSGRYKEANNQYYKVLRIAEKLKSRELIARVHHAIATSQYFLNEYQQARANLRKAIELYELEGQSSKMIADSYNLIGLTYYDLSADDSAIYFYDLGIKTLENSKNTEPKDYLVLYENKGNSLKWLGKYKEAIVYLRKTVAYNKRQNNLSALVSNYNQLISYFIEINELDSANFYLKLAANLPNHSKSMELKKDWLYYKLLVLGKAQKQDSIGFYVNAFRLLSDSLVSEKTQKNIKDAQVKYETEKKEAELKLRAEEAKRLNIENEAKSWMLFLSLALLVILLLVAYYFYRNFKQKRKLDALELEVKDWEIDELLSNQESHIYASMLKGQELERERIAQDLHDRLGGTLAALKLALRKPENTVMEEDLSIIDSAVNEVRSISHNLSTGLVHKYGLNEAVNQLFKTLESSKGIRFTLYLHPEIGKLGQTVGIELYRIVQELVSNTLKHAKATEVSLQTNFSDGIFNLIYEDNGVGFDASKVQGGIGLENVKRRVDKIGGELHIDAEKGRGSIFIVELKA